MFTIDVLVKRNPSLFERLSIDFANVALVLFVLLQFIRHISKTTESIQHDTWNDIAKHNSEEDSINRIVSEPYELERLHRLSDRTRNIQLEDTLHHGLAKLFLRFLACINIFLVVAECDSTEDEGKDNPHHTHIEQLEDIETDCFEDISYFGIVAEDIHDVDEKDGRVEECADKGYSDIQCYSPKLGALIQWLCRLPSAQDYIYKLQEMVDLQFVADSHHNILDCLDVSILLDYFFLAWWCWLASWGLFWVFPYLKSEPIVGIYKCHRKLN